MTLEDIIEEMIGEFTTSTPGAARADSFDWDARGECMLEGTTALRDINKRLGLQLPLDGPKTLNGLLLELLQDIPESNVSVKIANCIIEIVQVQHQAIKVVKLIRPTAQQNRHQESDVLQNKLSPNRPIQSCRRQ